MTWRTARRYTKTGGRGYGAEPRPDSSAPNSTPTRPTRPPSIPGTTNRPAPPPRIPRPEMPRPTLRFIPKGDPTVFHPPGPGIGLRPGPAPALGRPGLLSGDHGSWKNNSCFSRGSKGWKPDIMSLGDAHNCPGEKGPQSPFRPPNISKGENGYNARMFRGEDDVGRALNYLGYDSPDGNAMLRSFQRDWNFVSGQLSNSPALYAGLTFSYLPQGILQQDGDIGPNSLNALEVAIVNQRMANIPWHELVTAMRNQAGNNGHGRQRLYNAAQGM